MKREDLRAYASRDLVDAAKLRARAERFASEELLAHARACGVSPDRVEDLRRHIEWRLLLDRANESVLRRR